MFLMILNQNAMPAAKNISIMQKDDVGKILIMLENDW